MNYYDFIEAIKQSGVYYDIKSRIRKEIVCFLSEDNVYVSKDLYPIGDFHDRLSISCVYCFLSRKGLDKTSSVFLAETGFDSEKSFLSENEIENILRLPSLELKKSSSDSNTILHKIFQCIEDMRINIHETTKQHDNVKQLSKPPTDDIIINTFKPSNLTEITANVKNNESLEAKLKELQVVLQLREESLKDREQQLDLNIIEYENSLAANKEIENQNIHLQDTVNSQKLEIDKQNDFIILLKEQIVRKCIQFFQIYITKI